MPRFHPPGGADFCWPGTVCDGGQLSEGCGRWCQSQDVTKARGAALQRLHCAELLLFLRSETACAGPSQQEVEKEEVVVVRSHRARGPAWNARCRMSTWPRRARLRHAGGRVERHPLQVCDPRRHHRRVYGALLARPACQVRHVRGVEAASQSDEALWRCVTCCKTAIINHIKSGIIWKVEWFRVS